MKRNRKIEEASKKQKIMYRDKYLEWQSVKNILNNAGELKSIKTFKCRISCIFKCSPISI